jgi:ribosomal protein S18 acetylase RimI-like enzyme
MRDPLIYGSDMTTTIRPPDWTLERDRRAVVELLDAYANDLMGGGTPLTDFVKSNLCGELAARPSIAVRLAFVDDTPAGLCVANEGFSTFACRPLLNIHDIVVAPAFRGRGVGRALLGSMREVAVARGCCKLTLEVLENNAVARKLYASCGFVSYELDPRAGKALFLECKLA